MQNKVINKLKSNKSQLKAKSETSLIFNHEYEAMSAQPQFPEQIVIYQFRDKNNNNKQYELITFEELQKRIKNEKENKLKGENKNDTYI